MQKVHFLLWGILFFAQAAFAQKANPERQALAESITAKELRTHLTYIASDELEGRDTGSEGQRKAADYIIQHFKELGLRGPVQRGDNPYLQSFQLGKSAWKSLEIKAKGKSLVFLEDFFSLTPPRDMKAKEELVFAGYGLESEHYSDYKDLDVKDKFVAFLMGEPKSTEGKYFVSGKNEPFEGARNDVKAELALKKGAKGVFFIMPSTENFKQTLNLYRNYLTGSSISLQDDTREDTPFQAYTSLEALAKLLKTTEASLQAHIGKIAEKKQALPYPETSKVSITGVADSKPLRTANVLGYLEGTDKKDELIVITAHYDHVGMQDGKIYNGADDDGSGTVAVLEIAEAFAEAAKAGNAPRRSVLFITFTGEEKGLLGSQFYSDNPIFPLESTVTNLNIDMIGRVDEKYEGNPNYVYLIGSDRLSKDLDKLSKRTAKAYKPKMKLDYTYNHPNDPNRFYERSDHYNFAKHGIPVIFYFNGTHEDYHQPTDTVEKINFEKMEEIAQLIFLTAWEIAQRDERPKVDKK